MHKATYGGWKKEDAREEIRKTLVYLSGCELQEGADGKSWPCGTCLLAILGDLVDEKAAEYHEHNSQIDRLNEVWRFVLQLRDENYGEKGVVND